MGNYYASERTCLTALKYRKIFLYRDYPGTDYGFQDPAGRDFRVRKLDWKPARPVSGLDKKRNARQGGLAGAKDSTF